MKHTSTILQNHIIGISIDKLSSSGDNKNKKINVEAAADAQVKISKIDSTNGDSLQLLPECLKPTTLYDHHKIVPIPSHSIEKIYQEVGQKDGTTHHQLIESFFFFVPYITWRDYVCLYDMLT